MVAMIGSALRLSSSFSLAGARRLAGLRQLKISRTYLQTTNDDDLPSKLRRQPLTQSIATRRALHYLPTSLLNRRLVLSTSESTLFPIHLFG